MALEDKDIFTAICERFPDQPIEFIMQQYEKARVINQQIEKRSEAESLAVQEPVVEAVVETEEETESLQKRFPKRKFKVKAQDSITHDAIYCCLCGAERQSLTRKHLAQHGITVEEYKKICNFPPTQPLMSGKKLEKSKEIIAHAQQVRMEKRATQQRD